MIDPCRGFDWIGIGVALDHDQKCLKRFNKHRQPQWQLTFVILENHISFTLSTQIYWYIYMYLPAAGQEVEVPYLRAAEAECLELVNLYFLLGLVSEIDGVEAQVAVYEEQEQELCDISWEQVQVDGGPK